MPRTPERFRVVSRPDTGSRREGGGDKPLRVASILGPHHVWPGRQGTPGAPDTPSPATREPSLRPDGSSPGKLWHHTSGQARGPARQSRLKVKETSEKAQLGWRTALVL